MKAKHCAANAQNSQRQAPPPANAAPTIGPNTVATPQTAVIMPNTRARCRAGKIEPRAA
jgi:hypothetical protein